MRRSSRAAARGGGRSVAASGLVLLPVVLALGKCANVVHSSSEATQVGTRMTLPHPWIAPAIGWGAGGLALLALLLSHWHPRPWAPRPRSAQLGLVVVAIALLFDAVTGWTRWEWHVVESRDSRDGRTFALLEFPIWDKPHLALAVESGSSLTHIRYDSLNPMQDERHRPMMSFIVRPASTKYEDQSIWLGRNGAVVAAHGSSCWAGWNGIENRAATIPELVGLSPFVLLDDTSAGLESDIEAIEQQFAEARSSQVISLSDLRAAAHPRTENADSVPDAACVVPTEATLLAALDDTNPWVRAAARRIVEAGGAELYPEATKRIATERK